MKLGLLMACCICIFACNTQTPKTLKTPNQVQYGNKNPLNHQIWTDLLQKHVSSKGKVNYQGFVADTTLLQHYLNQLTQNKPTNSWSKNAQLAYWINVYNAFTVKLIVDNYPVASIKDIKKGIPFISTVWDIKFIEFENETIDLNKVEHGILRKKFDEPRIHFAVNCASFSCPRLLNEAFVAEKLEQQLSQMTIHFLNDHEKNRFTKNEIQLSKIFKWFRSDFTKQGSLIKFLNQYAPVKIDINANINYLNYNWQLND